MNYEPDLKSLILNELELDHAWNDVTTSAVLTSNPTVESYVIAKQKGVFSGSRVLEVFSEMFSGDFIVSIKEGDGFQKGQKLVSMKGPLQQTLGMERVLLNFLSFTCAVATQASLFVHELAGSKVELLATRKTLPGLRNLQLQAIEAGGAKVHRRNLSDGILIKDNHLSWTDERTALQLASQKRAPLQRVEIEVDNFESLKRVMDCDPLPCQIMLDNMDLESLKKCIALIDGRCAIEVSGGVKFEHLQALSKLPINYISTGALTHTVAHLDLSLEIV